MMQDTLLRAEHLVRHYGARRAVDGVSLELRRGEILGLLGPNGAGKTTTMQMLSGTVEPRSGQVFVAGIPLAADPLKAKSQLGYLPEQPPLHKELRVDEYLAYSARLRGLKRREVPAAVDRVKARCGLGDCGRRLIANLSKGYQQRVGLAQAIIHEPPVIILDEPTVGLDPIQQREIRTLIRELGRELSVILSTHVLPEVQAICDRVIIIHQGRVVLDRPTASAAQSETPPRMRARFLNPPVLAELRAVPGVCEVEILADDLFALTAEPGFDTDALLARALERGWRLCELGPEGQSLEELFLRLTQGDTAETSA